ncbi:MAG: bifunctional diaminohydroxyphosphoribosylaminopyrimidine deaminase/5-amino-6-(5-phosphoribosylamino)uracil reductase RibD [Bacillota bacterium]
MTYVDWGVNSMLNSTHGANPAELLASSARSTGLDKAYMSLALKLARNGAGLTSPNPMVGALIVRDGQIVGWGYHSKAGGPHAEVFALKTAGELAKGATMYVTLEPCCHHGQTPPCTDAILEAGIARVVSPMEDPNPQVSGEGFRILREAGVEVTVGISKEEARRLNEAFVKYITTRLPFVTVKAAMSIDGKIATWSGNSRWITGEKARRYVHTLRAHHDAIMVGIGTIIADNPRLTVRLRPKHGQPNRLAPHGVKPGLALSALRGSNLPGVSSIAADTATQALSLRNPVRVIVDTHARIPLDANVLADDPGNTIVATTSLAPLEKVEELRNLGATVIVTEPREERVDIREVLAELGKREITSVMLEGGGALIASAFEAGMVDKVLVFIAPRVIGGKDAPTWVEGKGAFTIDECTELDISRVKRFRGDILLEAYVKVRGNTA